MDNLASTRPEPVMSITHEDLKKIYFLLNQIENPRIIYNGSFSEMKDNAIQIMKSSALEAKEIMHGYDIEEL